MTSSRLRRARLGTAAVGLLTATLVPGLTQLPALASTPLPTSGALGTDDKAPLPGVGTVNNDRIATLADAVVDLGDLDKRGRVLPSSAQKRAAAKFGAIDLRWNQFGTPESILPSDGVLASGFSKSPAAAPASARSWIMANRAAFGLSRAQVSALTLVSNQKFAASPARAVLFRQNFGKLSPALDSMITVGVANGEIAYASSSITRVGNLSALSKKTISPQAAWLKAATNVGMAVADINIPKIVTTVSGGWTRMTVPGFAQEQLSRLRSLAMADGTVVPVFEANVLNVAGAASSAYTVMVNAIDGSIVHRQSKVHNENDNEAFSGSVTPTTCGPKHTFTISGGSTKTIIGSAAMANTANDIVVKLFAPGGALLASMDSGTSPEAATATSAVGFPAGAYKLQVCPFLDPMAPLLPPFNYAASATTSDTGTAAPGVGGANPKWRYFVSTPDLKSINQTLPKNSTIACWFKVVAGCNYPLGALRNVQAPGPWDEVAATGVPTLTTTGNNAVTREAWLSPLTPGGTAQAPVSASRSYTEAFTDEWNNSKCALTNFVPGGNDINPSVTDLFVTHNIMHDYSYYLGYTESNYNNQVSNLGRGGIQGDPEVGNAQAGAITGGSAGMYLGRDNANQIAMQDGVAGITNQYLFQPIAGAFYAPCTDGSLDFGIVGHEYTHEISNRMVGGPDQNISSEQGGAMGESWSDLNAAELLFARNLAGSGLNPFAVGVYATQNKKVAIRDFSINKNPLNYSDYGFDSTGPEVHADGEIWNGTQFEVRQALVNKYNKQFPYANKNLQRKCSNAASNGATSSPLPVTQCPGNRRWIQLIFDAWLLQPPATSMLVARDAMLAADRMRFGGRDQAVMWKAFAKRGMGFNAKIKNADDDEPRPSFATPAKFGRNRTVKFLDPSNGRLYVGNFEARVTPIADTNGGTKLKNQAQFTPGTYQMLYVARGRGGKRFTLTVKPGKGPMVYRIKSQRNLANRYYGGKIIGSTPGSRNAISLIDSTERTNWGGVTADNVDKSHPFVKVDLAGGVRTIRRVNVSAYLRPAPASATDLPILVGPAKVQADPDSASRFTALRQFALEACVKACSSSNAKWRRFFTSKRNAFPATLPRPVAPDLNLRTFRFKAIKAAAIKFVVLENQCTGNSQYAGEQDNDPSNATDCKSQSDRGTIVHAAELQVFEN